MDTTITSAFSGLVSAGADGTLDLIKVGLPLIGAVVGVRLGAPIAYRFVTGFLRR